MSEVIAKKPSLKTYDEWLCSKVGRASRQLSTQYASSTAMLKEAILSSDMWISISDELSEANDAYRSEFKTPLIVPKPPQLLIKPYSSLLNKSFRFNVLNNRNWPLPPDGGWMLPPAWISSLNDVFRTSLVVSYVDGIQFLSDRLSKIVIDSGGTVTFDLNSSMVGYYAGHLIVEIDAEMPNFEFELVPTKARIEIQITTHVKEAVKTILHPIYERARVAEQHNEKWQWDFNSEEFIANNLGHIIHYVEGMIVRVREDNKRRQA